MSSQLSDDVRVDGRWVVVLRRGLDGSVIKRERLSVDQALEVSKRFEQAALQADTQYGVVPSLEEESKGEEKEDPNRLIAVMHQVLEAEGFEVQRHPSVVQGSPHDCLYVMLSSRCMQGKHLVVRNAREYSSHEGWLVGMYLADSTLVSPHYCSSISNALREIRVLADS